MLAVLGMGPFELLIVLVILAALLAVVCAAVGILVWVTRDSWKRR